MRTIVIWPNYILPCYTLLTYSPDPTASRTLIADILGRDKRGLPMPGVPPTTVTAPFHAIILSRAPAAMHSHLQAAGVDDVEVLPLPTTGPVRHYDRLADQVTHCDLLIADDLDIIAAKRSTALTWLRIVATRAALWVMLPPSRPRLLVPLDEPQTVTSAMAVVGQRILLGLHPVRGRRNPIPLIGEMMGPGNIQWADPRSLVQDDLSA